MGTRNFCFSANIDPSLQTAVRREMNGVRLTGGDTMNFWIQGKPKELAETLKLVNVLLINDTEVKMLAGEKNLLRASQKVLAHGPAGAGGQAWRVRCDDFLSRRSIWNWPTSVSRAGACRLKR